MRQPRILDVMRAVRAVAPDHPEIRAFWYAPAQRLHLAGRAPKAPEVEVAVEPRSPGSADFDVIARELSAQLRPATVAVRTYRGDAEERHLFRIVSAEEEAEEARAHGQGGE